MSADDLTIRQRTMQIGARASPAGWEIMAGEDVFAWTWTRERAVLVLAALRLAEYLAPKVTDGTAGTLCAAYRAAKDGAK